MCGATKMCVTPPKPSGVVVKLTVEFDNQEALRQFAVWLCESGEQSYWDWMRVREEGEYGGITATEFHYHGVEDTTKPKTSPARYGEFMEDNTIRTTCGRLGKDDDDDDE